MLLVKAHILEYKKRINTMKQTNYISDKLKTKITICSDSQGKYLASKVEQLSKGRINAFGYVRPNTTLIQVTDSADTVSNKNNTPLVILGGTNNSLEGSFTEIYQNLEEKLKLLTKSRYVFLCTVPVRHDKLHDGPENCQIQLLNNYIKELVARIDKVSLIDLDHLKRHHFTAHGLHLNIKGTTILASKIIKSISWWKTKDLNNQLSIKVIETDIKNKMLKHKNHPKIAFAHCISGDFGAERQMTSGVAVTFRKQFGKPEFSNCLTGHLAYQQVPGGAGVYALVTKDKYNGKPTLPDYDKAFDDFIQDFKRRGFTKLVCSAMGCAQDKISIGKFSSNIVKFHQFTKTPVEIISYNQWWSSRVLRNGLTHDEFISELRYSILSELLQAESSPHPLEPEINSPPARMCESSNPGEQGAYKESHEQPDLQTSNLPPLEVVPSESETNNGQSCVGGSSFFQSDLN